LQGRYRLFEQGLQGYIDQPLLFMPEPTITRHSLLDIKPVRGVRVGDWNEAYFQHQQRVFNQETT
jgi:hypothetical protein